MNPDLTGKTILVTRPREYGVTLVRLLESAGASALLMPAIRIVPVSNPELPAQSPDHVFFISQPAVTHGFEHISSYLGRDTPIYAVGVSTAARLQESCNNPVVFPEQQQNASGLLASLETGALKNKVCWIVKGRGGNPELAEGLMAKGAHVLNLDVYERRCNPDLGMLNQQLLQHKPDCIVATSKTSLDCLLAAADPEPDALQSTRLLVTSKRLEKAATGQGFLHVDVSSGSTNQDILTSI